MIFPFKKAFPQRGIYLRAQTYETIFKKKKNHDKIHGLFFMRMIRIITFQFVW